MAKGCFKRERPLRKIHVVRQHEHGESVDRAATVRNHPGFAGWAFIALRYAANEIRGIARRTLIVDCSWDNAKNLVKLAGVDDSRTNNRSDVGITSVIGIRENEANIAGSIGRSVRAV